VRRGAICQNTTTLTPSFAIVKPVRQRALKEELAQDIGRSCNHHTRKFHAGVDENGRSGSRQPSDVSPY